MRVSLKFLAVVLYLGALLNLTGQALSIVQFVSASYSVAENAGSVTLTVQRIGPPNGLAYVDYATSDISATSGEDYVARRGYLQFEGETNLTIVIPVLNDALLESHKSFSVALFNPDPFENELGTNTVAVVTIVDNDWIQFSSPRYEVRENEGSVVITVSRGDITEPKVEVSYETWDGTATAGSDFVATHGTLLFEVGESNKTIRIPIVDDALVERDESFDVFMEGQIAEVIIMDDDPGVEFGSATYSVDEGAGTAVITVKRRTDFTRPFSVDYVVDGCGATASQNGTLIFVVGERERGISIPILDDHLLNGDQTALFRLSNPVGTSLGLRTNAALIIRDRGQAHFPSVDVTLHRLGTLSSMGIGATALGVAGNFVYEVGPCGLAIVDVSDCANLRPIGRAETRGLATGVRISCNRAFVGEVGGLEVFDVSDPTNPHRVGDYQQPICQRSTASAFEGNLAALAVLPGGECGFDGGIVIIDISTPEKPRHVGTYRRTGVHSAFGAWGVALSGSYAYAATVYPQLEVIDISDPEAPYKVAEAKFENLPGAYQLAVSGNELYLNLGGSMAVMDVGSLTSPQGTGIRGLVDGIQIGRFHAAGGRLCGVGTDGMYVMNVSDPANPKSMAFYPTAAPATAVTVAGDRAYLATASALEIVDLNPFAFGTGSPVRLPNGQVQLTLNTRANQSYTLQASTNLVDWESLETRIASDRKLIFTDTNALKFERRFYRAVPR